MPVLQTKAKLTCPRYACRQPVEVEASGYAVGAPHVGSATTKALMTSVELSVDVCEARTWMMGVGTKFAAKASYMHFGRANHLISSGGVATLARWWSARGNATLPGEVKAATCLRQAE